MCAQALKTPMQPDANRLRRDGLRWIPAVNGAFNVPVLFIHILGDMYVPFGMQQSYLKPAAVQVSRHLLVQRAVRGALRFHSGRAGRVV